MHLDQHELPNKLSQSTEMGPGGDEPEQAREELDAAVGHLHGLFHLRMSEKGKVEGRTVMGM